MENFVDMEKQNLQTLFDAFNKVGSTMTMAEGMEAPLRLGEIDSYTVTRVTGAGFWLMFKVLGYDEGFQHTHTVKVEHWSQDDTWLLDLIDDRKRRFHIELIFPKQEPELADNWRRWRAYRSANRDRFKRIDAQLLAGHIEIANNW